MCIEYVAIIVAAFAAAAAVLQAVFAGFLWRHSKEQTSIIKKQTEIMNRQNEIIQKVEESANVMTMRSKYASLWGTRKTFWEKTRTFYNAYKGHRQLEESLDSLISDEGFPHDFDPTEVTSLLQSVKKHEDDWTRRNPHLWEFARFVYPNDQDANEDNDLFVREHARSKNHLDMLDKARSELAYFWDDWASKLDIRRYRPPELAEVIMLTWLELACVRHVEDRSHRPGKKDLFRLAKEEWKESDK